MNFLGGDMDACKILAILETQGFKNHAYVNAKKLFSDSLDMNYEYEQSFFPKDLFKLPFVQLSEVDDKTYLRYLIRHFRGLVNG